MTKKQKGFVGLHVLIVVAVVAVVAVVGYVVMHHAAYAKTNFTW